MPLNDLDTLAQSAYLNIPTIAEGLHPGYEPVARVTRVPGIQPMGRLFAQAMRHSRLSQNMEDQTQPAPTMPKPYIWGKLQDGTATQQK